MVGTRKVSDLVKANFGQDQFAFDIDGEYRVRNSCAPKFGVGN